MSWVTLKSLPGPERRRAVIDSGVSGEAIEAALEGSSGGGPILLAALSASGEVLGVMLFCCLLAVSAVCSAPLKVGPLSQLWASLVGAVAQRPTLHWGVHTAGHLHPPALGLSALRMEASSCTADCFTA